MPAPFPALERSQERIQRYNVSRNSRVPRSRHVRKGHHICCSPIPAKEHTSRAADGAGTPLGAKASPLLLYTPQGVEEITASRSARRLGAEHCSPTRPHEACATCQTPTPRFGDPGCVCKTGSSGAGLPPAAHAATPYRPAAPLPGPHGSVSAARMAHLSDEKASRKSSAGTYGGPTDLIGDTAKARVGRGGRGAPRGMLGAGERGSACRA